LANILWQFINNFNMKKIYLLLAMFCASIFTMSAQFTVDMDQIDDDVAAKGRPTINRYRDNFTMWSVAAKAGLSFFDGDVAQKYNNVFPKSGGDWVLGISAERSFTPLWGIGVEYLYIPMRAEDEGLDFDGYTNNASVYASLDIANLLYRYRRCKFQVYLNIGIGMTFYHSESTKNSGIYIQASGRHVPIPTPNVVEHGRCMQIPVGVNAEWNFHRNWALSWNTQYRFYNKDNMEADKPLQGIENDGLISTTLGIRYKFGASKKPHMRNICLGYMDKQLLQKDDCCEILTKQNEQQQIELDSLKAVLSNYSPCINKIIKNGCEEPKKDTVYAKPTPKDIADMAIAMQGIKSVYFAFDSYKVEPKEMNTIRDVIKQMQLAPDSKVEIRGYCDPRGNEEYNQRLSDNRTNAIRKILIENGIDASRITMSGYGKSVNEKLTNDMRRRCDFFLTTSNSSMTSAETLTGKISYKVEILSSKVKLDTSDAKFKGVSGISYYEENGYYKYTCGDTDKLRDALKTKAQMKALFPNAKVITFVDGVKN